MPYFDDDIQKALSSDEVKRVCVEDGYSRIDACLKEDAFDYASAILGSSASSEFSAVTLLASAYLEGAFHYHQCLKELEPETAARMETWMDLLISTLEDIEDNGGNKCSKE